MSIHRRAAFVAALVALPLVWGGTLATAAPPDKPPTAQAPAADKIPQKYKDKVEKAKEAKEKKITRSSATKRPPGRSRPAS